LLRARPHRKLGEPFGRKDARISRLPCADVHTRYGLSVGSCPRPDRDWRPSNPHTRDRSPSGDIPAYWPTPAILAPLWMEW
jgi:hypothetical protein